MFWYAANASSNFAVRDPVPIQPERTVATSSSISALPMSGLPNTRYSARMGTPPAIAGCARLDPTMHLRGPEMWHGAALADWAGERDPRMYYNFEAEYPIRGVCCSRESVLPAIPGLW